jgi:3-dehydroquinate dehydratase-1
MAARKTIPRIVGVIFSLRDLRRAVRLRRPPDFFELRLDALVRHLDEIESAKFPAPLILTARDPREGGVNNLTTRARRDLLVRFLPRAHTIDIELRSAPAFSSILDLARATKIQRIISLHDFQKTPPVFRLHEKARAAQELGADLFKIATRTDTSAQLSRLLDFHDSARMPVAAMGLGRLGRAARRELMRRGSILNYAHLGSAGIAGQPSLSDVRRWMAAR